MRKKTTILFVTSLLIWASLLIGKEEETNKIQEEVTINNCGALGKQYSQEGLIVYEGECKDGKAHGFGTLYDKAGKIVYAGHWREGRIPTQDELNKKKYEELRVYDAKEKK